MADSWITLLRFSTVHEGEVARGLLESAGIEAQILDREMMTAAWHLGPILGGVRLQVRPEDRALALEVLAGDDAEIGSAWEEDEGAHDADEQRARRFEVYDGDGDRGDAEPEGDDRRFEVHQGESMPDEDADEEAQRLAKRALTAALLGVLIPFVLHAYSALLLLRLANSPGSLDRRGRAWAGMALALDALVLLPALAFVSAQLR